MPEFDELCSQFAQLMDRIDACDRRATGILLELANAFKYRINAPEKFTNPRSGRYHPYVAAYKDDQDPNSTQQYQVVRDARIELPRDEEGKYEGYVGLTMSREPDAFPKKTWLVKCRIKVHRGSVDVAIADQPAINVKGDKTFEALVTAFNAYYRQMLSFDPVSDATANASIDFIDHTGTA